MTYTRRLYKQDDNSVGRLASGMSAGSLSVPLQAGQGALFPTTFYGVTTSLGTATLLNCTGIQALGVVAGMIIQNITDGSYAVVLSVSTNSVTTTNLKGGSANIWGNTEKWVVNPFVVTLVAYDTDGVTVLKREKVLIDYRTTDTLYVNSAGRGFDGSSAQTFATNDYVYLFSIAATIDGIQEGLAQILQDIEKLPTVEQQQALVGSSGLPNSTNKFLTEDDATIYGQGLSQATQNATIAVGEANATTKFNKVHQTFIAQNTSFIAFYLYKKANTGTNAGNVIIQLTEVDGSNNPTGGVLATCTILAAAWNALANDTQHYLAWSVAYTMTIGTTYALQITQSTADNSNHINLGYQNTDVYTSGVLKRWNTTDGYVTVTGDLYFSFLTTTNSKIIRKTGTGQIYQALAPVTGTDVPNKTYVDNQITSAINSFPINQQLVGADTVLTTASTGTKCATDSAGTIMVLIQRISGTWYITRYASDSGIWYRTHSVTLSWNGSAYNSVIILGSYVYVYGLDTSGPTVRVTRFNLADLTSATAMTISGGTPTTTDSARAIHTDGTFIYLSDPAVAGRSKKYSLSGTTITYVSDINYTGMNYENGVYNDGTFLYGYTNSGYGDIAIVKYTLATGGAALSTTNRNLNGVFMTNAIPIGFIPYTASKFWIVMHGTIDAVKTMATFLIAKP